jgi:DNA replication protein DnaC
MTNPTHDRARGLRDILRDITEGLKDAPRVADGDICLKCGELTGNSAVMNPQYACKCGSKAQEEASRRLTLANLPTRGQKHVFETYEIDKGSMEALEAAKNFAAGTGPNMLVLYGGRGTGKSHLMESAGWSLLADGNIPHYAMVPELLDRIKATFNDNPGETTEDVLSYYRGVHTLLLDDFGTEKATDFVAEKLTSLIDERYRNGRRLMITTNLGRAAMEIKGYDRLADRLFDQTSGDVLSIYTGSKSNRRP